MNKKVIKTIEEIEEYSMEEVADDFLDHYYESELEGLKKNLEYEINIYLVAENINHSEEEKESFIKLVNEKIDENINNIREPEIKCLSNRKSIHKWLSGLLDYMRRLEDIEPSDVGFLLSVDEIIDLIIQNGNK